MRHLCLAALLILSGPSVAVAQEQADPLKAWLAMDWEAKGAFLRNMGATTERECDGEEGKEGTACWSLTTVDFVGWTLTMTKGEGPSPEAVYCFEKTGGLLRWCKDDGTGETQKFFRNGDEWVPHGG